VWQGFQEMFILKGHTLSVWAVLVVDVAQTLTASADKTIRLWEQSKQVHRYNGHTDAVRGLALVPNIGFASCSNDRFVDCVHLFEATNKAASEIRVWTFGGDVVYTLPGHTSFVYSLALLPSGDIVSGGEDRTARVWKDGECTQTIVHPAISVWTVSAMPNGDIVTGCSDGNVRIYSAAEERWASEEELTKYDELISMQAIPSYASFQILLGLC
jgi:phospholipase A-2-activating protein